MFAGCLSNLSCGWQFHHDNVMMKADGDCTHQPGGLLGWLARLASSKLLTLLVKIKAPLAWRGRLSGSPFRRPGLKLAAWRSLDRGGRPSAHWGAAFRLQVA